MKCPSCRTADLSPQRLESGLSGYSCPGCSGVLLSVGPYVDWVAAQPSNTHAFETFAAAARDSKRALLCPKCSRIMVKFRVSSDSGHGLDFCFGCEEVWLDGGEWTWLKAKGLHTKITTISTGVWQRRLREEWTSAARLERFKQTIGMAAFPEVERFKVWLESQPERSEILRYLTQSV